MRRYEICMKFEGILVYILWCSEMTSRHEVPKHSNFGTKTVSDVIFVRGPRRAKVSRIFLQNKLHLRQFIADLTTDLPNKILK